LDGGNQQEVGGRREKLEYTVCTYEKHITILLKICKKVKKKGNWERDEKE
jgi:hypothetical protein